MSRDTSDPIERDEEVAEIVAEIRGLDVQIANRSEELKNLRKDRENAYARIRRLYDEGDAPLFDGKG